MQKICRLESCKKDFETNRSFKEFCTPICRSRYWQKKNGKSANTIDCVLCGEPFSRKGAKNTRCPTCRDKIKLGEKIPKNIELKNRENTPKEQSMIDNFLKGKK